MENDNSGIESGANDMGSMEGSVSAEAPGSVDTASLEAGTNNGMSGAFDASAPVDTTTLDLGLPTFVSSPMDVAELASSVASGLGVVALLLSGSPAATPAAALAGFVMAGSLPAMAAVLQDSAVAAQFSMGNPGAFVADAEPVALYDTYGGYIGMGPPPVQDYWQYMGIST